MAIKQLFSKLDGIFSPMVDNESMHIGTTHASHIISRCMQIAEFLVAKNRPFNVYSEIVCDKTQLLPAGESHYFDLSEGMDRCSHRDCNVISNEITHFQLNTIQQAYVHGNFHFCFISGVECNVNAQVHFIRDGEIIANFATGVDLIPEKSGTLIVPFGGCLKMGDQIKVCCLPINGKCKVTRGAIDLQVSHITTNPFNTPMNDGNIE